MIDCVQKVLVKGEYKKEIKNSVELLEKKAGMKVKIAGLPNTGLKIHFEKGKEDQFYPAVITKEEKGYRQICDYLILMPNKSGIDIYFIELKKNPSTRDLNKGCRQISATIPFLDYLASMVEIHFDKKPIIEKHFVVITEQEKTIKKKRTRNRYEREYDGRYFRIIRSSEDMPLNHLRCRNRLRCRNPS